MNNVMSVETEELSVASDNLVRLPLGLLGFERHTRYLLVAREDEAPFAWLQMADPPQQAFLVLPTAGLLPDYHPELSEEDVDFLDLRTPDEAFVLNIVTLRSSGQATVNLKGPVVINRRTRQGKQAIPLNASQYAVQHPLPAH
jgi:flagellar assembly factor FliW